MTVEFAKGLVSSTRWPMGVLSSLMTIASFRLALLRPLASFAPAFTVFLICGATMMMNDLVDRHRDALQNKTFARDNFRPMLISCICAWILAFSASIALWVIEPWFALLSLGMCALGIEYSWTRTIPGLPMVTVALTTALACCYPLYRDGATPLLPLTVFFALLARETYKDCLDLASDLDPRVGKKTLPVIWGTESALTFARGCLVITGILILQMGKPDLAAVTVIGICLSAYILAPHTVRMARKVLDLSILIYLCGKDLSGIACLGTVGTEKSDGQVVEIEGTRSGLAVWLSAYTAFAATIYCLGFRESLAWRLGLAVGGFCLLLCLRLIPVNREYGNKPPDYVRVQRMIIGMVIGLAASALSHLGIHLVVIATLWPLILIGWNPKIREIQILKDQATILGIALMVALNIGPAALLGLLIAYVIVVGAYYLKAPSAGLRPWGLQT